MKKVIAWFAENHVAANMLMFFLLFGGIIVGLSMKVEIFPETSLDRIAITVEYPGASPEEVEEGVILPVEEAISGLSGIKEVDSTANEGMASIVVELLKGWDVDKLYNDVKSEVDRITTLPTEAEDPIVRQLTIQNQVISIAVFGPAGQQELKDEAQRIKDEVTALPGISLADLFGDRENEIHVSITENTLRKYHLTLEQVAQKIRANSLDLPAGNIKASSDELLIRTKGRRYFAKEFSNIPVISRPDGREIRLGDLGNVTDAFEDVDLEVRFQGQPAIIIQVYRIGEQNALDVAARVKEFVERQQKRLPPNIHIQTFQDMSKILKSRIKLLLKNMAYGLALVVLLLGLFLNFGLAFWVTLGIPVSFAAAVMFLPNFDVSINMISLFAFIMVLGIVVDDAIVIGENIYSKYQQGMPGNMASVEGAHQVGRAVIFSVFTTVAAFWPLLLGTGHMGKFMRNMPIVVNLVLIASLAEALLVLPCHLNKGIKAPKGKDGAGRVGRWLEWFISRPYRWFLELCLEYRYLTLTSCICILALAIALWTGGWIKFTFFPKVEADFMSCNLTLPPGTPFEYTRKLADRIRDAAEEVIAEEEKHRPGSAPPLLKYTLTLLGLQVYSAGHSAGIAGSGGNVAEVFVQLLDSEKKDVPTQVLVNKWRKRVGQLPGVESLTFSGDLFGFGSPVQIDLSLDDYRELVRAADDLKAELARINGVFDISDSFIPGKKEIRIRLKPAAACLGLTLNDLASQVRSRFYGAEAMRFQRGKNEVKVKVLYPEVSRDDPASLVNMRVQTPSGYQVPFSEVADIETVQGYSSIKRVDRRRVITVFADVDESIANANEIRRMLVLKTLPALKQKYPTLHYTEGGEGKEQAESFADVKKGLLFALLGIFTLLAIPLRSFAQPVIIMLAIPFSMVGAIIGHLLLGFNLSILSMFGMVGLAGVAVNDSLVLFDAANILRKESGLSMREAAKQAGLLRFRAVLLTSLTTFAGLMPMIMEKSIQARFLIPMAISLGFGIMFATLITLILVPCGYLMLEDLQSVVGRGGRSFIRFLKLRKEE
ncbi:MAG: acriflavin resistance protein [Desulfococcus sp. 4484_241]|nr:MAG: acriflavin resistance protein [Desulfococcus sp. 4484_241]